MRTQSTLAEVVSLQVEKMRAEIRLAGFVDVGCEELDILCSDLVTAAEKTTGIGQIAEWEGWNAERLPEGRVRFSVGRCH